MYYNSLARQSESERKSNSERCGLGVVWGGGGCWGGGVVDVASQSVAHKYVYDIYEQSTHTEAYNIHIR